MPKVLIVDDDPKLVSSASEYLVPDGWEMVDAHQGEAQAPKRLGERSLEVIDRSFDAVILDLNMPGMRGEDVLAKMRARPDLQHICVVILTAYARMDTAIKCLRMGAYQYLQKPFKLEDLKRLLISGIAIKKARTLPRSLLVTPASALAEIESIIKDTINPAGLHVVFLNPDGTIERIVGGYADISKIASRRFVTEISNNKIPIFESNPDKVKELQPITPDAKSLLAAPVLAAGEEVAGILDIESSIPGAFDPSSVEVISELSDLLAISLQLVEKQALMAERKKWQELPIVLNELRHHISTPTQIIAMHAREFREKDLKNAVEGISQKVLGDMSRRIEAIEKNADDIKRVCTYLTNVSDEIPINKSPFDLRATLGDCLAEISSDLEQKYIRLNMSSNREGAVILEADPMRIRYCLQCLLQNSIEAIEERRNQVLDASFDPATAGDELAVELIENRAQDVQVSIKDTGIGISQENQARIFQPLFSTKQRIEQGGMGLFSVRRIMNQHEGNVTFESAPGKGAKFTLLFPQIG